MAKLAFLVPRREMVDYVKQTAAELKIGDVDTKLASMRDVAVKALECIQNGADVLVARGYQAKLIKKVTNVPVVEITMTGQEMAMLVHQAKCRLKKERPVIGVVGSQNMFPNMSLFNEIFGVELKTYFVSSSEDINDAVSQMYHDGVDLMIGGDTAIAQAEKLDLRYLFLSSHTGDSIREAFDVAQRVGYASDLEKEKAAELKTLLDYSFNGIIQLDSQGKVSVMNHVAEAMLQTEESQAVGRHISSVMEPVRDDLLDKVIKEGQELYASFLKVHDREFVVNLAPIQVKDRVDGAIISFTEINQLTEMEARVREEIYRRGFFAHHTFESVKTFAKDPCMTSMLELAKKYAGTDSPVLIVGAVGTEKETIAQCIHNESMRSNGAYLTVQCGELDESAQYDILFGSSLEENFKGAIALAHDGTLVLQDVDKLSFRCQQSVFRVLKTGVLQRTAADRPLPVRIRLICTAAQDLALSVQSGAFYKDLFYLLSAFKLRIPPLMKRPGSMRALMEHYLKQYESKYSRLLVLTKGAREVLLRYEWPGNLVQLDSFCRKIVISTTRRTVDEAMIRGFLEESYPIVHRRKSDEKIVVYKNPEAAQLAALLDEYGGNRTKVAERLNISKTTLWRKMKKYNISGTFEI